MAQVIQQHHDAGDTTAIVAAIIVAAIIIGLLVYWFGGFARNIQNTSTGGTNVYLPGVTSTVSSSMNYTQPAPSSGTYNVRTKNTSGTGSGY